MRNLIIAVVVVLILALGYFLFIQNKNSGKSSSNSSTSTSNSSNTASQTSSACDGAPAATNSVTINYSDSGFSPKVVSVTSGGTVTVKNSAKDDVSFNSDPHPVHTDDQDLNLGTVTSGSEKSFTVTKTGCFGYHNHLSPDEKGNILIK